MSEFEKWKFERDVEDFREKLEEAESQFDEISTYLDKYVNSKFKSLFSEYKNLNEHLKIIESDENIINGEALIEVLQEVVGCFDAAYAEGLQERLMEIDNPQPGSLADLITRRLLPAFEASQAILKEIGA